MITLWSELYLAAKYREDQKEENLDLCYCIIIHIFKNHFIAKVKFKTQVPIAKPMSSLSCQALLSLVGRWNPAQGWSCAWNNSTTSLHPHLLLSFT